MCPQKQKARYALCSDLRGFRIKSLPDLFPPSTPKHINSDRLFSSTLYFLLRDHAYYTYEDINRGGDLLTASARGGGR